MLLLVTSFSIWIILWQTLPALTRFFYYLPTLTYVDFDITKWVIYGNTLMSYFYQHRITSTAENT